jgi:hypothetical protein
VTQRERERERERETERRSEIPKVVPITQLWLDLFVTTKNNIYAKSFSFLELQHILPKN